MHISAFPCTVFRIFPLFPFSFSSLFLSSFSLFFSPSPLFLLLLLRRSSTKIEASNLCTPYTVSSLSFFFVHVIRFAYSFVPSLLHFFVFPHRIRDKIPTILDKHRNSLPRRFFWFLAIGLLKVFVKDGTRIRNYYTFWETIGQDFGFTVYSIRYL